MTENQEKKKQIREAVVYKWLRLSDRDFQILTMINKK